MGQSDAGRVRKWITTERNKYRGNRKNANSCATLRRLRHHTWRGAKDRGVQISRLRYLVSVLAIANDLLGSNIIKGHNYQGRVFRTNRNETFSATDPSACGCGDRFFGIGLFAADTADAVRRYKLCDRRSALAIREQADRHDGRKFCAA